LLSGLLLFALELQAAYLKSLLPSISLSNLFRLSNHFVKVFAVLIFATNFPALGGFAGRSFEVYNLRTESPFQGFLRRLVQNTKARIHKQVSQPTISEIP
jgi:hypothetical protein